jgi:hypothetical protein
MSSLNPRKEVNREDMAFDCFFGATCQFFISV